MRPARSWNLTSWYCDLMNSRVISLPRLSLMILNTYGNEGSVNTAITSPLIPGAITNWSVECRR